MTTGGEKQMTFFNCDNRFYCPGAALIVSFLIGVIAAFLQITGVISVTSAFLWVVLGIAVVYLAVLLISVAISGDIGECGDTSLSTLLAGILGSALFSVILLAVSFTAGSILGAIFVGALLFFLSLTLTSAACLVRCIANN